MTLSKWTYFLGLSLLAILNPIRSYALDDQASIARCLENWKDHPFHGSKYPAFKTLHTSVRVIGIGKEIKDLEKTEEPQLVLVSPTVNILTGTTISLMNPNGWYCFKSNVTILASSTIRLACDAHIASDHHSAAILASDDDSDENGGTTILGSAHVVREGCSDNNKKNQSRDKKSKQ